MARILSGVQPSAAQVHIGNYLGAMKRFVELSSESNQSMFCIVNLHALTSVKDGPSLKENTKSLAAAYLAIGLDPEKTILFKQSDVPEVCELTWYLSCQFPLGLLERSHALKDARSNNKKVNSGLMFYPILMAADILLYKAEKIPVGADQKQHIEMTRDVAQAFNHQYGDVFPLPDPLIEKNSSVVTGLDGRKMSKSYDNYIGLFEDPKKIEKKIKRIVTDSKGVEEPKDPETCNLFGLHKLFASKEQSDDLAKRYRAGGLGYGTAKAELYELIMAELEPMRVSYDKWMSKEAEMEAILADGASRAREIAGATLSEVRQKLGLD